MRRASSSSPDREITERDSAPAAREAGFTARRPTKSAHQLADPPSVRKEDQDEARRKFKAEFAERCVTLRGRRPVADVAAQLGVHRNTLWNIERGETLPDAFELTRLAEIYRTTVSAMLGHTQLGSWAERSEHAVQVDNFVFVPHFDVQASAGHGSFQDVGNVVAMRPFDSGYIRGELGISHEDIGLCGVTGNSGEPILHSRDTVLVDFRDRSVMIEGLHIVRLDGLPLLKKLQRLPGKVLRVSSNNEEYAPFDIIGGEDNQRDFEVIGRVRWAGVTFR